MFKQKFKLKQNELSKSKKTHKKNLSTFSKILSIGLKIVPKIIL